ncbi:hypothetical protein PanWU01x14_265700 [Parasponia andersonii]|uniref:Uncharacterized protein n=1 Tax=Parasponia andersonii TaxID=3476 RepID=A0A2P5B744_PARAD|nr:hypothetical protein PanWU01x14_265700 [Parasponia andersonii]
MDVLNSLQGSSSLDVTMEDRASTHPKCGRQPVVSESNRAAVLEELNRMSKLPATSTYVSHRLRVLNKILQLLSLQRTTSQDMELELLFAGLSL